MKRILKLIGMTVLAVGFAGCQTNNPVITAPVPTVALATSHHRQVFDLNRPVVTEFGPADEIAISVHIPRGGGYGIREGTLIVRNASTGRIIRREVQTLKEDDYIAFQQENPGPGKYNVEFIADNGVLATTWFEVR
jgi:hypothetical protein